MQQGDAEWLKVRDKCAVTGSRVGDAVGVGYNSRQKYWRQKKKLEPKTEMNWRMSEGIRREPWVAELYFRIMGAMYAPVTLYTDAFTYLPWDKRMGGSVDRVVECDRTGERWVLEIKTAPDAPMRTKLPVSHNLQMLFLCKTLGLSKAHYICHSQGQGIFLAEVTWDDKLWDYIVMPRLRYFADMIDRNVCPPKMKAGEKESLIADIEKLTHVKEIECVSTIRQLQRQRQIQPNKAN